MTETPADVKARAGSLLDRYQVPPFSVLDTRQGYWQEARRAWLALGIRSELGRGSTDEGFGTARQVLTDPDQYRHKVAGVDWDGPKDHAARTDPEWTADDMKVAAFKVGDTGYFASRGAARKAPKTTIDWEDADDTTADDAVGPPPGTSIFDPVLCELAYRWWCPPGGRILDPFAGGSVRGIVAAWLGHDYTGVDLSRSQVESNREQANTILAGRAKPSWIVGDSRTVLPDIGSEWADFVWTCPPYYDLEVYSDDPADLSAMSDWPAFVDAYTDIIGHALTALKRDRFAGIVVSEIRGKGGTFRGLVPMTIRAFELHGARYYNEGILVNPAGTLPMRIGRQFDAGRKLGRSHQNVLVFVKGDVPRTHEWGTERTGAPDPQTSWLEASAPAAVDRGWLDDDL